MRSEFPIPSSLKTAAHGQSIFWRQDTTRCLSHCGRPANYNALLIVMGDHGDYDYTFGPFRLARLESYDDSVLSPIFMLKPPAALPTRMRDALETNARRLVANIDIAPTVADFLAYAWTNLYSTPDTVCSHQSPKIGCRSQSAPTLGASGLRRPFGGASAK